VDGAGLGETHGAIEPVRKLMIRFEKVSKHYGASEVLRRVSFEIAAKEKVGLIGRNGAGKTTLLHILLGQEEPSEGIVEGANRVRIGYVPQALSVSDDSITVEELLLEDYLARHERLRLHEERLAALAGPELDRELLRYQKELDEHQAHGGDAVADRASGLLQSLGLEGRSAQPVSTLSGGEKNILGLARALLADPELLILDEPGNHLDFDGLAWLEQFLVQFRGGVLVVSHNRYLLDRVVSRVLELEACRVTSYAGNYSEYRLEKLRKLVAQQSQYVASQKRLTQLEELVQRLAQIARVHAEAAWGKRLRARRSQLQRERGRAVERPELDQSKIRVRVEHDRSRADIALQVKGYTRSIAEHVLFQNADLEVRACERIALIGPNGCGKTTFLSDVVESGNWEHPVLRVGPSMTLGYCAQHQETLTSGRTVLAHMVEFGAGTRERAFAILSRYLFAWEDLEKLVDDLSGGERNRLQLATLELLAPSFLILDEPTNHMDVFAREAIEEALEDFSGTLILVSHDRYLLEKLGAKIVQVRERRFERFEAGFSEFWAKHKAPRASGRTTQRGRARKTKQRTDRHAAPPSELERRITAMESERQDLELRLTRAFDAGDHAEGRRLSMQLEQLGRSLKRAYDEWVRSEE
jgi:ATP-binding cassette subfamily F protein 3